MSGPYFTSAMIDECMKNEAPRNSYISCIKIAGVPILPPLVTPEKRLEMQNYKKQAIEIEKRLGQKKLNKTLENSLAYESVCDENKPEQNLVPLKTKPLQLSCNVFDVTEYNDNGIILFNDFDVPDDKAMTMPQPRLIRSNSYTLDAPSPVLMEHFKKHVREFPATKRCRKDRDDGVTMSTPLDSAVTMEMIRDLAIVHFGDKQKDLNISPIAEMNVTSESPNSSSVLLIDFESDTGENLTFCCDDSLCKASILDSDVCYSPPSTAGEGKRNCSRALFADTPKTPGCVERERAATVLTAAVRGYLVRRLKRTERVKNLIQTIHEALLCAMSLHTENSFQPSDVELHRRLIQQISAACYEFYDVFFNLSVKEKMEIIALDRQKMKEKLKRPSTASKSDSSRKSSLSSKQKKTLVTSLVA